MQTHNLLKKADAHVQHIAYNYKPRAQFAFAQQLSSAVKCTHIYSDDADVCFVFKLQRSKITVDVYCNYNSTCCTGNVYGASSAAQAAQVLQEHFNLQATSLQEGSDSFYYCA